MLFSGQCPRPISRDTLRVKSVSPDGQYYGKLLFILLSTFFPWRKKVAKNRHQRQNLRFSSGLQLPRDARSPPIREGDCNSVSCVSQRRNTAPAAERLGAHTAPVDRWEVGRIAPSISSNVEAIVLTFRDKLLYGKKLRLCKKLSSALLFWQKISLLFPFAVRTVGSRMRLVRDYILTNRKPLNGFLMSPKALRRGGGTSALADKKHAIAAPLPIGERRASRGSWGLGENHRFCSHF